jgi:hypothetical protein
MSLCRFARDSDVYVYRDYRGGFTCCGCTLPDPPGEFRAATTREMAEHLLVHRGRGEAVPEEVFSELAATDGSSGGVSAINLPDHCK